VKRKDLPVVRGSGNVYRDFGHEDADIRQLKAILAAEIVKTLGRRGLTLRQAHAATQIAAADFSRVRNADLRRFTVDRLMTMLSRLGSRVEVRVKVKPVHAGARALAA
jgi:predicted XRE-type DNA-binding protein